MVKVNGKAVIEGGSSIITNVEFHTPSAESFNVRLKQFGLPVQSTVVAPSESAAPLSHFSTQKSKCISARDCSKGRVVLCPPCKDKDDDDDEDDTTFVTLSSTNTFGIHKLVREYNLALKLCNAITTESRSGY